MDDNWTCVYSTGNMLNIEIARSLLEEINIESYVMNRQDSNYFIGDIELYVKNETAIEARKIIENADL